MPTYQSAGTYGQSAGGNPAGSVDCGVPSGVVADDTVVLALFTDTPTVTITAPAGFTEAANSPQSITSGPNGRLSVYWKRATTTESGTYTTTFSANSYAEAAAIRVSGCITSGSPFDVTAGNTDASGSSSSTAAVSATTTVANTTLVHAAFDWSGGTWTPASGFTSRSTGGFGILLVETKDQAVAGGSGTVQAVSTSTAISGAWLGALKAPVTPTWTYGYDVRIG